MSYDKPEKKIITLNVSRAKWLLEDVKPFLADRPLSRSHVAKLTAEMLKGRFMPETTTIMVADLRGTLYRLNGQHTATAVLKCLESNPGFSIPGVTLLTYSVSDETTLRQIYARVDRGAARSNGNVAVSILAGVGEFADATKSTLKLLASGLAMFRYEDTNKRNIYSGESSAEDVHGSYLAVSKLVVDFLNGLQQTKQHTYVFRAPVVAALYATFAVDADDARLFWKAVATGIGLQSESEPAARLNRTLISCSLLGGHEVRGQKTKIGSEEMYRACLHAWNRFRSNDDIHAPLRPTLLKKRPEVR